MTKYTKARELVQGLTSLLKHVKRMDDDGVRGYIAYIYHAGNGRRYDFFSISEIEAKIAQVITSVKGGKYEHY